MKRWLLALSFLFLGGILLRGWWFGRAFSAEVAPPVVGVQKAAPTPPALLVVEARTVITPPAAEAKTLRRATPSLQRTTNILLVGIDRRPGKKRGGRPDTLLVAALDEASGHLGIISVPRDLYVHIPDHGHDRINATFAVAWSRKQKPLDLLERVLEDTLQLPISHRISIDLGGFEELVDALGGVDVQVPCPIVDNFIDARTDSGRRFLSIDAGIRRLSGVDAALYVRSRHGRSDWSRARRQQAVLFGIKSRFETIGGLSHLPEFYQELRKRVSSDMSHSQFFALARRGAKVTPDKIHGLVLGVKQARPHYTEEGKAVLLPDFPAIDDALSRLFQEDKPGRRPQAAPCPDAQVALRPRKGRVKLPRPDAAPGELARHDPASDQP